MNILNKVILLSILAIIGALVILLNKSLYNELFLSHECWAQINAKDMQFEGLVKKKFIDSNNHNIEAIDLIDNNVSNTIHFVDAEELELWEKVQVNDSIKKSAKSLVFYLKDSVKWDTIIIKYDCK